jgi:hypothetical protein
MNLVVNTKIIGSSGNKRNKAKLFGAYRYQFDGTKFMIMFLYCDAAGYIYFFSKTLLVG